MKKSLGAKTILYPTPVLVVGSFNPDGRANAMTAAWGGICCSQPPAVAVSLRKSRQTYDNVMEQRAFTVHVATEPLVREADYLGIASGRTIDKLANAELRWQPSTLVHAPILEDFPLVLECRLLQTVEIGVHVQMIGEIVDVKAEEGVLNPDNRLDLERLKPLVYAPEHNEYRVMGGVVQKAFSTPTADFSKQRRGRS